MCLHSSLFVVGVMRTLITLFTVYVFASHTSYEGERGNRVVEEGGKEPREHGIEGDLYLINI